MSFQYSFTLFNPKTGETPKSYSEEFKGIAKRARNILEHRTEVEIRLGLEIINRMYFQWEHVYIEGQKIKPDRQSAFFELTPTQVLIPQLETFDINPGEEFKNARREEYFAIVALALIGNAVNADGTRRPYSEFSPKYIEINDRDSVTRALEESEEAVDYAEYLVKKRQLGNPDSKINIDEFINEEISRKKSEQTKSAANERHDKKKEIYCRFVEFLVEGRFKVFRVAVKQFYEKLTEKDISTLWDWKNDEKGDEERLESLERTLRRFIKEHCPHLINPKNSRLRLDWD